jgi:hypothetical protein
VKAREDAVPQNVPGIAKTKVRIQLAASQVTKNFGTRIQAYSCQQYHCPLVEISQYIYAVGGHDLFSHLSKRLPGLWVNWRYGFKCEEEKREEERLPGLSSDEQ